jgi:TonB family protein
MAYLGRSLRRRGVRERPAVRVLVALALSLALNALGAWLLVLSGAFAIGRPVETAQVALAPIDAKAWEANRAVKSESAAAPRPPSPPDAEAVGPVVELPPKPEGAAPDEAPKDARHSAERNQKVEHETVSRYAGVYPKNAPKPQIAVPGRSEAGGEGGDADQGRPGKEQKPGDRLALAPGRFGELSSPGEGGAGGRRARGTLAPDLRLGSDTAEKVLAGPNMDGFHEGLDAGEETALNTSAFRFATFFNRMKTEIGHEWYPRVRDAQHARDPEGSMFFYKDRTVALGITLDSSGRVKDLSVLETSNVDFFDRVALDSVRAAQPFPNPPQGLLGGDGEARFSFSFTLVAGDSHGRLRWLRAGPQ